MYLMPATICGDVSGRVHPSKNRGVDAPRSLTFRVMAVITDTGMSGKRLPRA